MDVFLISLTIMIPDLGVPEGLINVSVSTEDSQGFSCFSFNLIKFTPEVFFSILNIFQENVSLVGVFAMLDFLKLIGCIQPLALVNFRIPFGS